MQYFGGKSRTCKEIASVLKQYRKENQLYVEPFVGAGWVMNQMDGARLGLDKHHYLISMYHELQKGWIPPESITEDEYKKASEGNYPDFFKGFIGFGCSFSGKWFGGYARNKRGDNYCLSARNSVLKKMKNLNTVTFIESDYRSLNFENTLIYCDPPYQGMTQYGLVGEFDSVEFWDVVRKWSKNNTVIISEYKAPDDFECIWERKTNLEIRNKDGEREKRIEKLFVLNKVS